jgi:hypothetical protein
VEKDRKWHGTIVEIHVNSEINFEWSHGNLDRGKANGYSAAAQAVNEYRQKAQGKDPNSVLIIGHLDREQRKNLMRQRRQHA